MNLLPRRASLSGWRCNNRTRQDQDCKREEEVVPTTAVPRLSPLWSLQWSVDCYGQQDCFWQYPSPFFFFCCEWQVSFFSLSTGHCLAVLLKMNFSTFHYLCKKKSHYGVLFNDSAIPQRRFRIYLTLASTTLMTERFTVRVRTTYPSAISNVLYCVIFYPICLQRNFQITFTSVFSFLLTIEIKDTHAQQISFHVKGTGCVLKLRWECVLRNPWYKENHCKMKNEGFGSKVRQYISVTFTSIFTSISQTAG